MLSKWVRNILQATVYDVAIQTPLDFAPKLSARFNNDIRFEARRFTAVFSFKLQAPITELVSSVKIKKLVVLFVCLCWQPCSRRGVLC